MNAKHAAARRRSYAHAAMERALSEIINNTRRYYLPEAAGARHVVQTLRNELRAMMPAEPNAALAQLEDQYALLAEDLQHAHLWGGDPAEETRLAAIDAVINEIEYAILANR